MFQEREFSTTLYMSKWYNVTNPSDKKLFLFLLANSQREIAFSAFGVVTLSMETFLKVF